MIRGHEPLWWFAVRGSNDLCDSEWTSMMKSFEFKLPARSGEHSIDPVYESVMNGALTDIICTGQGLSHSWTQLIRYLAGLSSSDTVMIESTTVSLTHMSTNIANKLIGDARSDDSTHSPTRKARAYQYQGASYQCYGGMVLCVP